MTIKIILMDLTMIPFNTKTYNIFTTCIIYISYLFSENLFSFCITKQIIFMVLAV